MKRIVTGYLILIAVSIFTLCSHQKAVAADKKVAVLPLAVYADESKAYLADGLKSMIVSRLSGEGINLIEDANIKGLLTETDMKGVSSRNRAEDLAKLIKADYGIFGSITSLGNSYSLDFSLLDLSDEKTLLTNISRTVNEDQLIPKMSEIIDRFSMEIKGIAVDQGQPEQAKPEQQVRKSSAIYKAAPSTEPFSFDPVDSLALKAEVMSCDLGNLDGKGDHELVVMTRKELRIYSREKKRYALKDKLKPSFGDEFLKVSVGDSDGSGRDELCVVSLDGFRVRSDVWEWSGDFKRLYSMKGHLQITPAHDGKNAILLFQESIPKDFFYGDIWMAKQDGSGKPKLVQTLDIQAQIYTLTFYDLNRDGNLEILGLGGLDARERSIFYIWDIKGEILWESQEKFGGTNNLIELRQDEINERERIPFGFRPVIMDLNGDGIKTVIVGKNNSPLDILSSIKSYKTCTFTAFEIKGLKLRPLWTSREIEYAIVDMQEEGGILYLASHKPRKTNMSRASGRVLWFE